MREFWVAVSLLWLAGVGLRLTILAVPPVISLIQADLHLSGTEIGILSGLPVILFGIAALPGSLLVARFGALATLVAGLLITGVASGLRGAALDVAVLYGATILMSGGIAIMQPALPLLVRQWLPQRVSFGTAVYSNGLLVAETVAVLLTIPIVLPLVDNSWRLSLAVWGAPLIVIAALTVVLAPPPKETAAILPPKGRSWWPDWSNKLIWQLGFVFGAVNSTYFCSNGFLPGHLTDAGRPDLIGSALTALNFGQLPASFALLGIVDKLERRAWPFMVCGALMLLCVVGIAVTANLWTVVFAGMLGFLGAFVMTLGFALPALLSSPSEMARMSAAMFTVSYSGALVVSVLSGAAWDLAGSPAFAFLPIALSALPLLIVPPMIRFNRTHGAATV
ncbi:MAG: MFS transporter [Xanthobacteraceae bacterium]|jgi:MFS transporter, CP family, cyanate transporter